MDIQNLLTTVLTALSILVIVGGAFRWIIRKYLEELKPNSGSSLKDQVTRLEQKVDKLFDIMIEHINNHNNK